MTGQDSEGSEQAFVLAGEGYISEDLVQVARMAINCSQEIDLDEASLGEMQTILGNSIEPPPHTGPQSSVRRPAVDAFIREVGQAVNEGVRLLERVHEGKFPWLQTFYKDIMVIQWAFTFSDRVPSRAQVGQDDYAGLDLQETRWLGVAREALLMQAEEKPRMWMAGVEPTKGQEMVVKQE